MTEPVPSTVLAGLGERLEPCPPCGQQGVEHGVTKLAKGTTWRTVTCRYCEARVGLFRTTPEAVAAWNAREPSSELLALREALTFYRDEFKPKIGKPVPGASSITFHPSEALLEDCGNRAMAVLAARSPQSHNTGET